MHNYDNNVSGFEKLGAEIILVMYNVYTSSKINLEIVNR